MSKYPIRDMVGELGTKLSRAEHADTVLNTGRGRQFEIKPSEFVEITPVAEPRKIAFVDGGNGVLYDKPNFLIVINRVYFSMFRGKARIAPRIKPRIQFYSYITSSVNSIDGEKTISYETRLFAHDDKDRRYLPAEEDLASETKGATLLQEGRYESMGRKFAELQLAIQVVNDELERGDMIVVDGSLQTSFNKETKYSGMLYEAAMQKGVIVCGLAKTSRLVTESGEPLLARIAEIAREVRFGMWYVRVAEEVTSDDRGFMLAVRFHEKSPYVFRFEILREQFERMNPDEINSIMASMAANSQDVAMLGYPYGAIDADRFAQVRMEEKKMYQGIVTTEMLKMPEWKRMGRYDSGTDAHGILNEVTS